MYKSSKIASSVRSALMLGLASLAYPLASTAQEIQQAEAEQAVEKIEVTGSRIKKIDLEPTRPVSFISSDYIAERGITDAQSAVTDIPGVFAAASPEIGGNTAAAGQGVGQRTINIFGLGSQRTLTLVNGGRFVSSNSPVGGASAAGSQLDVNNIPLSLIDRVEVVKVGGAAVYGADAVAGVVNYVLKDDYEGAEISIDNKFIGGDLGDDFSVRGLVGGNFDSGKGNMVLAVEYNKLDNILARDVDSLANGWTMQTPAGADRVLDSEGEFFAAQRRLYPQPRAGILSFSGLLTPGPVAATNVGLGKWSDGNFYQMDPSGSGGLATYNPGTPTGNTVWASGGDGLDLTATNTAQEGYERWNITTKATYEINDDIRFNFLGFANSSEAANPGYQAAQYNSGVFGGIGAALKFNTSSPFLTDASRAQLEGLLGGPGDFYYHRGWTNLGQREVVNESNVYSLRFAFDGELELGSNLWNWEVAYQRGWSSVYSQSSALNDFRFLAAMDAGINPETGAIDCKYNYVEGYAEEMIPEGFGVKGVDHPLGKVGDCTALNPFGVATEAAIDYVLYNAMGKTRIEQEIFNGYLSGDVFELPAGMFSMAAGFEYRKEGASFSDDAVGSYTGTTDDSLSGGYDTTDAYAEFYVPVVSSDMDLFLLHSVSLEASYRTMDNSRSGRDDAWALGVNYRPIEDVMIRGNVQRTVRAPAVSELFLPRGEVSLFGNDPCDARFRDGGPNPSVRKANCDAQGIPADFNSVAPNASRRGFTGGNENLQNEQSKSSNIGVVYNPSWLDGMQLSVDYVEIDINDAIVSFTLHDILNACYDATDFPNQFCGMFKRGDDFQILAINAFESGYVNAALRSFRAMEYNASYTTEVNEIPFVGGWFGDSDAGRLDVGMRLYNVKKNATSNTGADFTDTVGRYDNPDWRGDLRFRHVIGDLTTLFDIEYHGRGKRDVNQTNPLQYIDENGNPFDEIESRTLAHLSVNYHLTGDTVIRARIDNLFDWEPSAKESAIGRWTYGQSFNVGFTTKF